MPNTNATKNLMPSNITARRVLNRIAIGRRVRLRDHVYKQVREREWILGKVDSEGIHLLHPSKVYGLIVRMEDIDWSELEEKLVEGNPNTPSQRRGLEN